jgi:hypothetical protein
MKTILVSVCASIHLNKSRKIIPNRVAEANFYVFRYNFASRPSILILKRLAESSEHADSEAIYFFFEFLLLKASKAVKTTFRPVCVCVRDSLSYLSARVQKKIQPFEITSSKE